MEFSPRGETCRRPECPVTCAWAQHPEGPGEREVALTPLSEAGPIRLAIASVEIGRELTARGRLRLVVSGTCMYPNLRPGDILSVEPWVVGSVAVGDVLVFRRGTNLFGHRVVEVGQTQGRCFVITQPDRSSTPDSDPVWEEDVIGIAASAERSGRRVSLELPHGRSSLLRDGLLAARLSVIENGPNVRAAAIGALGRLQSLPVYGSVARRLLSRRLARITYRVRLPLADGRSRMLSRELSIEDALNGGLAAVAAHPDGTHWTITATLPPNDRPIGLVTYSTRSRECPFSRWTREHGFVRASYRGLGLEQDLIAQASRVLHVLPVDARQSTSGEEAP